MRLPILLPLLGCLFSTLTAAWTVEDHEIFRLRDEVTQAEGLNVTFYDFLGVKPSSAQDEITRALRRKSKQLHPDKARQAFIANYALKNKPKRKPGEKRKPGVHVSRSPSQREIQAFMKEANARYARLSVVANVLKGPARERYDHFLKHGFPKWRGTGYYYSRYRPGLGTVMLGLFLVFGGAAHYGALILGWKRQRDFVERYIRHARQMAWGNEMGLQGIPGIDIGNNISTGFEGAQPAPEEGAQTWNRRQKRMQGREERKGKKGKKEAGRPSRTPGISTPSEPPQLSGPRGAKKRVVAENGKVLIVDSVGNVFLEEETEEGEVHEFLLDVDEIAKPTIYDTAVVRVVSFLYQKSIGRLLSKSSDSEHEAELNGEPDQNEDSTLGSTTVANPNSEVRKRKSKAKANGR